MYVINCNCNMYVSIDVPTGYVVDYTILLRGGPDKESEEFQKWYTIHELDCAINYSGSSNAMTIPSKGESV